MRRGRNRRNSPKARSLFARLLSEYGVVFTASRYELDGVSGDVAAFVDWKNPARKLVQLGANQCAEPAADELFGDEPSAAFAGAEWYDSNDTASYWSHGHSGQGGTLINVFVATNVSAARVWLATRNGAQTGFYLYTSSAGAFGFQAYNGTTQVVNHVTAGGAVALNTPYIQSATYLEGASPEWVHRRGSTTIGSGASLSAPTNDAPSATLRLGANTGGGNQAVGRWVAMLAAPKVASLDLALSWLEATYGISV